MIQYVKQENLIIGEHGKEARATRLITERASRRIGQMAFEIAQARPRKVSTLTYSTMIPQSLMRSIIASDCHPQIKCIVSDRWIIP
jgi:isocitrate/isopropylmalate dehydrogenase